MFETSWQMGKHLSKGESENHFMAQAVVEYHPTSAKDQSRLHQFGKNVRGMFLEDALIAGWIWKGDIFVAEIEEEEMMDALEIHPRRINAKEVLKPQRGEYCKSPVEDGAVKWCGRDQEFWEPTLRREQLVGSEELQGEPEGFQPTESKDDAEAWRHFLSTQGVFIYRHLIEPRVQLKMPKEETFPIPLKYIDIVIGYLHISGRVARETYRWLLKCGRGSKFIRFLERMHEVHFVASDVVRGETDKSSSNSHRKENSKSGQSRSQNSIMLEDWEAFIYWSGRRRRNHETCEKKVGSSNGCGRMEQRNKARLRKLKREVVNPPRFHP